MPWVKIEYKACKFQKGDFNLSTGTLYGNKKDIYKMTETYKGPLEYTECNEIFDGNIDLKASNEIRQQKVLENDKRLVVWESEMNKLPFSSFVSIKAIFNKEEYRGSGTIIGPRHVITARHVIYTDKKIRKGGVEAWATKINIYRYGDDNPIEVCCAFTPDPENEKFDPMKNPCYYDRDIALLVLEQDIGLQNGWLGMLSYNSNYSEHLKKSYKNNIYVGGYQSDFDKHLNYWQGNGKPRYTQNIVYQGIISYTVDTDEGQSGGPVYIIFTNPPPNWDFSYYLIGVHCCGYQQENFGSILTFWKFEKIYEYICETMIIESMEQIKEGAYRITCLNPLAKGIVNEKKIESANELIQRIFLKFKSLDIDDDEAANQYCPENANLKNDEISQSEYITIQNLIIEEENISQAFTKGDLCKLEILSLKPRTLDDGTYYYLWDLIIQGKSNTIWEHGKYKFEIFIHSNYPKEKPTIKALIPIGVDRFQHCNVLSNGKLNLYTMNKMNTEYISLVNLAKSIYELIHAEPIEDESLSNFLLYLKYKENKKEYEECIRKQAKIFSEWQDLNWKQNFCWLVKKSSMKYINLFILFQIENFAYSPFNYAY